MKKIATMLLPSVLVTFLCAFASVQLYSAGVGAQPAIVDAGIGSGSGSALATIPPPPDAIPAPAIEASKPSDSIDNPIEKPAEAFDDLKAAKKVGWAPLLFAALVMLGMVLARAGGVFTFLSKGNMAIVVAGIGAVGAAGFDALMLGGTWVAVISAIVVSLATLYQPKKKPVAE